MTFTLSSVWLNISYSKHNDHDAVYIFTAFRWNFSRYEQIDESSFSVNVSTDSCVETLIPENNDFFPKCDNLFIETQSTKKSTSE